MVELVNFAAQYEWIFNFKVTDFFIDRVWEKASTEWLKYFETLSTKDLDGLPFGRVEDTCPASLKQFITESLKYSLPREVNTCRSSCMNLDSELLKPVCEHDIPSHISKGMTEKKLHEVCHLASLIHAVSKECQTECVVDVGSGLGYLGQVLYSLYHHKVLGLEGKQTHASGAEKRTAKNHTECPYLQNRTCELYPTEESDTHFKMVLSDWLSNLPPGGECFSSNQAGSHLNPYFQPVRECDNKQGNKKHCVNGLAFEDQEFKLTNKKTFTKENHENYHKTDKLTGCVSLQTSRTCIEQKQTKNAGKGIPLLRSQSHLNCVVSEHTDTCILDEIKEECCESTDNAAQTKSNSDCNTCVRSEGASILTQLTPICMVGLHCCGDLTPTMLKYFTKMEFIKSICVVSCCYHRMEYSDQEDKFTNFPLSQCVNQTLSETKCRYPDFRFTPYSMRLAAQETRARWKLQTSEDHDYHVRNVAYRGILEILLKDGPFKLKKTSRKMVHRDDYISFERYITAVSKHIDVQDAITPDDHIQSFQCRMNQLYKEYEQYFIYIEPITALQFLLQPVLESLIYLDRLEWLREQGFDGEIIPLFDEFISPRNLALIAIKR